MNGNKMVVTPDDKALFEFDARNNVRSFRAIANDLVWKTSDAYGGPQDLVDAVSHALEDAYTLGVARGPLCIKPPEDRK
jgi:hypothetical protein